AVLPYLLYVELAVLKALCLYCTIMHAFIIIDFILISVFLRRVNILRG
ncbi:MAG: VKOR family protein, partial [Thermoproteus sp.]